MSDRPVETGFRFPGIAAFPAILLCVLVLSAPAAPADDNKRGASDTAAPALELPGPAETRHSIATAAGPLDYRAIAETIGLTNQKGEPSASIFTVSYIAAPPAAPPAEQPAPAQAVSANARPVAFVFNGGPGASAVFLHLGALGPRVLETPPNGAMPNPPFTLVDNPHTWLAFTDLVFVDPVGTGYSRGKGKDENPDKPFWEVRSDLRSLSAVVRRWLTRHDRWSSPVFLVGESYGGLRAAALGSILARDVGVAVSGFVLVSPALDIDMLHPDISDILAPALQLPSYAAAAAAFAEASPTERARDAERFALTDYLTGLAALSGIPDPGNPLIERTAALIGLPAATVRRERGRVDPHTFARELRGSKGEILSVYDATVPRPATGNPRADRAGDPVLNASIPLLTAAFQAYASGELEYRTDQPYRVLARDVSNQWNWNAARGEVGLGIALSSLQDTLLLQPKAKVFVATGLYDLVTPYFATRWLLDQLSVPASVRARIDMRVYEGGHMMYTRPQVRAAVAADAASIFTAGSRATDTAPTR